MRRPNQLCENRASAAFCMSRRKKGGKSCSHTPFGSTSAPPGPSAGVREQNQGVGKQGPIARSFKEPVPEGALLNRADFASRCFRQAFLEKPLLRPSGPGHQRPQRPKLTQLHLDVPEGLPVALPKRQRFLGIGFSRRQCRTIALLPWRQAFPKPPARDRRRTKHTLNGRQACSQKSVSNLNDRRWGCKRGRGSLPLASLPRTWEA